MLFRVIKFFDVISNELSYAVQVTNQWQELEQVSKSLSHAVEEIKILKAENEKLKKFSESADFYSCENKKLLGTAQTLFAKIYEQYKEVEALKAENKKLKDWDIAYQSLLKDYYEVFDRQREFKRMLASVISPNR